MGIDDIQDKIDHICRRRSRIEIALRDDRTTET
jgi:hypothetical protein